jgi:hypothetical protein
MFGYETPHQCALNARHGWDDEDCGAFFVEAADETAALHRGRDVAEAYVRRLFERANWKGPIPSWIQGGFAHWIERHSEGFEAGYLDALPSVSIDEAPGFEDWAIFRQDLKRGSS